MSLYFSWFSFVLFNIILHYSDVNRSSKHACFRLPLLLLHSAVWQLHLRTVRRRGDVRGSPEIAWTSYKTASNVPLVSLLSCFPFVLFNIIPHYIDVNRSSKYACFRLLLFVLRSGVWQLHLERFANEVTLNVVRKSHELLTKLLQMCVWFLCFSCLPFVPFYHHPTL